MDVALATCLVLPEPDPDEPILLDALAAAGLSAGCLAWDDPDAPFGSAALTIIRSTWNYHRHLPAFLRWVDGLGDRLANPAPVIRWNAHKSYLIELANAGIRTVPTVLVARGVGPSLEALLERERWSDAVAKPAVSAASFETRRVRRGDVGADNEGWFARMLTEGDMLLQPYVESVDGWGERAVVVVDGRVSHAVRKEPRFSGQDECVSSALEVEPDERALAERALALGTGIAGVPRLLYGRVDMARDESGAPMVMELELIEPSLFLAQQPSAIPMLVGAIAERLRARTSHG